MIARKCCYCLNSKNLISRLNISLYNSLTKLAVLGQVQIFYGTILAICYENDIISWVCFLFFCVFFKLFYFFIFLILLFSCCLVFFVVVVVWLGFLVGFLGFFFTFVQTGVHSVEHHIVNFWQ